MAEMVEKRMMEIRYMRRLKSVVYQRYKEGELEVL